MTFSDVTALEESKRTLQALIETVPVMIAYIDTNRTFRFVNSQFAEALGLPRDSIIGMPVAELLDPDGDRAVLQHMEQAFAGNVARHDFEIEAPTRRQTAYKSATYVPDSNGASAEVRGCYAVIIDLTERRHSERELERREAHLRRVIDHAMAFIGVLDTDGTLLEANQTALSAGGLERSDVIGRRFWDCYWWNYDAAVANALREAVARAASGDIVRYDVPVRLADEAIVTIDFMLVPVRDEAGAVTHLIPSGVDISKRIATEQALADSTGRLKLAMRAARMGSFDWNTRTDESVWDDGMQAITGLTDGVAGGARFFELIHPDDVEPTRRAVSEALATRGEYEAQFRIRRPDGQIRWIAARGQVLVSRLDGAEHLHGLNWDITEERVTSERLHDAEDRMRMAAKAAGFGTYYYDLEQRTVEWSGTLKEMIGCNEAEDLELQPGQVPRFVHPDDRDRVANSFAEILADTEHDTHSLVYRIVRPDAEVRWLHLQGRTFFSPGTGAGRRPQKIVGTAIDITTQKQFEQTLEDARNRAEQANQTKSAFIANLSHEIRTPMTAVLGYTQLLTAKETDPEKLDHLHTIKRNGRHLLDIINDILDLSKIEAGRFDAQISTFDLHELVAEVRSMMAMRARGKKLRFDLRYEGVVPQEIRSDRKRLKQILTNLLGNAIKFTQQGSVELVTRLQEGRPALLRFDVIDTGIGISAQHQSQLFQPFVQGDASVARRFGGTGLGLDISRRLARTLGGDISLQSEENRGSTFTFVVPIGDIDSAVMVEPQLESTGEFERLPSPKRSLKCRALVVDDHDDVRALAQRFLIAAGAQVELAAGGSEALQRIGLTLGGHAGDIDVVLLDMHMPDLDGRSTARQLREMGFRRPIIALTAEAMHGDMRRCIESGCDAYLSKPIDSEALIALMAEYLAITDPSELERRRASALQT
ncbi:MAG: PAS domain S-box protein [Steroidobacteraceae bacterium]